MFKVFKPSFQKIIFFFHQPHDLVVTRCEGIISFTIGEALLQQFEADEILYCLLGFIGWRLSNDQEYANHGVV